MNKKYLYTNQKELRAAFWQLCAESDKVFTGKKTVFNLELNMIFIVWIDGLRKAGLISDALASRACLY